MDKKIIKQENDNNRIAHNLTHGHCGCIHSDSEKHTERRTPNHNNIIDSDQSTLLCCGRDFSYHVM